MVGLLGVTVSVYYKKDATKKKERRKKERERKKERKKDVNSCI